MTDSFPVGDFFIRNVASGKVLDVEGGSTAPGAAIIVWDRKSSDYDNQLWRYDEGFIVNKKSGLCLEVPGYEGGGGIKPGTSLVQAARREQPDSLNQLWAYNYQSPMPYDPKVCLWGEDGDVSTPGTKIVVDTRMQHEVTQEWMFDTP
ncbi:RICIN domain-containing protein [Nocardia transvalensis]|uniref:RICIN domain-containing protein n=1 Tax=Nocardia transvalensis TaxID=37333 RepID=UPI0018960B0C|nr:RICIN domain-containing protein [Nocardia transvalensis]MBF6333298.1 RICIN domain-containing protein [Nocardia transvalensis]